MPHNIVWFLGAASLGATLIYIALIRLLRRHTTAQAYIQFCGDLILITCLVYYLGGAISPFSLLYLIVIAVASTLLRRRAGVIVASLACLLYGGMIVGLSNGWLHPASRTQEVISGWRLNYNLAVHGFGFYVVALLTYYLAHNVTRAERALEEKSEHLADLQVVHRDVIQSITSGLLTTDLEGIVTSANLAGLEILGRDEAELVGNPIHRWGLFTADHWREATAESERTGRMRSEVEVTRGDGAARHVGFTISRLTDAFGNHRGYIVIFQDLTRWRRIQEELRMKDRMVAVGELAAGLAHEIGNPLAAISGSVQMLAGRVDGDPAAAQADRDPAQGEPPPRPHDQGLPPLRPPARTVERLVRHRAAAHRELRAPPQQRGGLRAPPPGARPRSPLGAPVRRSRPGEPDLLEPRPQLAAGDAGRRLAARSLGQFAGEWYKLQVIDSGRGMTEEQRTNLFHPFQSFFDGGTGIGMAIVYRIVQDHGGRLRVDSRPGAGTTITVELPTAAASVTLVSAEAPA